MPTPINQRLAFDLKLTGMTHELKTWPEFYDDVAEGRKPFEFRYNDREDGFQVGDWLILREWQPAAVVSPAVKPGYTGRLIDRVVTYVLRGEDVFHFGRQRSFSDGSLGPLEPPIGAGWVVLGLALPPEGYLRPSRKWR